MKLNEILDPKRAEISKILLSMNQNLAYCKVDANGVVSLDSNLYIFDEEVVNGILPIKFDKIRGHVWIHTEDLTSFENFPTSITGNFMTYEGVSCDKLTSFEHFPISVGGDITITSMGITSFEGLNLTLGYSSMSLDCPITSFIGIADHIKSKDIYSSLEMDLTLIKEGGIGLIYCNLNDIFDLNDAPLPEQFEIIYKYLCDPDSIYDCQEELVRNGFEAYAQL